MTLQTADLHVNPSDETIPLGFVTVRFLVTAADSSGSVAAFEVTVPGRQRLRGPAHSHTHYEETIYGLSGVLTWTVDGKVIDLSPGQILCIPRGAVHRFDNNADVEAKVLCVVTPAAIGPEYFREVAALVAASAPGAPPDKAKVVEIMLRYGLIPSA